MKTRQEIKQIGKERFTQNYWPCVCAALLVSIVFVAISLIFGGTDSVRVVPNNLNSNRPAYVEASSVSGLSFIGNVLLILVTGPLTIGLNFFFVQNFKGLSDEISVGTPFSEAFTNFGRKLGGYLWAMLWTFLWSLLLVIPGIIKSFSYAMAQYILADCPEVKATDALKLSMRIMDGRKWDLFVVHLSFIGWQLLSGLTLGILGIFFVEPYRQSAFAGWYLEAREDALRRGVITIGQLEGTEAV